MFNPPLWFIGGYGVIKMTRYNAGRVLMAGKLMDLAYCNRPRRRCVLVNDVEILKIIDGDKI